MQGYNRRVFLKGVAGASLAASLSPEILQAGEPLLTPNPYDAKGLPTAILGKTGVVVPKIVMGLGSRFCHIDDIDEAHQMLNYALDHGFYYWDTAHIYDNTLALPPGKKQNPVKVNSEERLGEVVKYRRKEIFLSTKVSSRDPEKAMREIESSLKRLQTDKLDMLKIHDVQSMGDVDQMSKKGNLIDILVRLKEEGITRFIGFSGHSNALALKEMTNRADFDSMLVAMNHWRPAPGGERQEMALPAGKEKKMGVLLMKVIRPKESIAGLDARELVRYALSIEGPDALVIGMDSIKVVDSNIQILKNFTAMQKEEIEQMAQKLDPFYRHENLPWMDPQYCDGNWSLT